MLSDEDKELLKQLPGGCQSEYIHVPQPDGTLKLKRFLDCLPSDLQAHIRWLDEVIKRADPAELDFVAQFYADTPERAM